MCTIVGADCLFGSILTYVDKCDFPKVVQLRNRLQQNDPSIVIDLSGRAVQEATRRYAAYFNFDGACINRIVPDSTRLGMKFLKREFLPNVPSRVLERMHTNVGKNLR
jgi:hypothetical protein